LEIDGEEGTLMARSKKPGRKERRGARSSATPSAGVERFEAGEQGPFIAYEHTHRYALAAELFPGRRVLDLASGSGHGSTLLRRAGAEVTALDVELRAARRAEPAVCASGEQLPFAKGSFDGVVCFEALEHFEDPDRGIAEIGRVLDRRGVAILSTPDRELYTDLAGNRNPHHISEMNRRELLLKLKGMFRHVALYGQSVWAGSWIARLDDCGHPAGTRERRLFTQKMGVAPSDSAPRAPWIDPEAEALPAPLYLIAVCAQQKQSIDRVCSRLGTDQILNDRTQWLLGAHLHVLKSAEATAREAEAHALHASNLEARCREREARVEALEKHATNLEHDLDLRLDRIRGLEADQENLSRIIEEGSEQVAGLENHAENLAQIAEGSRARVAELETHAESLSREAEQRRERITDLETHAESLSCEVEQRRERITDLEAHAENLERDLARHRERIANLEVHAENLTRMLEAESQHASNLASQLSAHGSDLSELRARASELELNLVKTSEALERERGLAEERGAALARIESSPLFRLLSLLRKRGSLG
jgi:SAM-dependent methyltransferase